MTAKQKVHQAKLAEWAALIQDQTHSGLTIKQWCQDNNISFNAYNYWKHLLKEEYVDACLPDIVQVPASSSGSSVSPVTSQSPAPSRKSRNSCNSREPQPVRICTDDVDIAFSPMVSDELILRVLKAVRYA